MIGSAVRIDLHPDLYPKVTENFPTFVLIYNQLDGTGTQREKLLRIRVILIWIKNRIFILMRTMQLLFEILLIIN